MVVLPMMVKDVTVNVTLDFKDKRVKKEQLDSGSVTMSSGDIVVGKYNLTSLENYEMFVNDPSMITSFIRKNISYNQKEINSIYVTTMKYPNSDFYDIYKIPLPNFASNKVSDYIYGLMVNNIRLSIPNTIRKEIISLENIDFDELFSNEFLNKVSSIKGSSFNSAVIRERLIEEGYKTQLDILDFLNNLDYSIGNNDIITSKSIDSMTNFFEGTKKEYKMLNRFRIVANSNYDSYVSLGTFNSLVYNKPLTWPVLSSEQQKILLKKVS